MTSFSLPARLDTPAAVPLRVALKQRIEAGDPVDLMAAEVDLIGMACLQVLASAHKTALLSGRSFRLTLPSDALRDACELAGLNFILVPHEGMPA